MIRNLLATTAIATLVATGAMAQTAPAPTQPMGETTQAAPQVIHAEGHLASNIIGENVYNGTGDDAENIGSVTDIIIAEDNSVEGIVVGVGGFLGLGQKNVAIEYDAVEWSERDGDRFLVISTTREALEALPDFDSAAYSPQPADADVAVVAPATRDELGLAPVGGDTAAAPAPAAGDAPPVGDTAAAPPAAGETADEETTATAPADGDVTTDEDTAAAPPAGEAMTDDTQTAAIDRSTLTEAPVDQISADDFVGTTVYGVDEENVGSINDVILSSDGAVEAVIVDVGGFLGMGAKEVAISMDNLQFMSDADGDLYLYTSFTQEQLEAQPEYDEATFADNRDDQLLQSAQ